MQNFIEIFESEDIFVINVRLYQSKLPIYQKNLMLPFYYSKSIIITPEPFMILKSESEGAWKSSSLAHLFHNPGSYTCFINGVHVCAISSLSH